MKIQNIIENNKNSVILLQIEIPQENNQNRISIRGTGFIISSNGRFITNAHVYKQIPENELQYLRVSLPFGDDDKKVKYYKSYPTQLLFIDEENDIALMEIINYDRKSFIAESNLENNPDSVQEGDESIFIGYPLATDLLSMGFGITMTTNRCIISSIKRRLNDGSLHFFLIDTHTNNGSSGSPLFSIETGKVVGIVSGKISTRIPTQNGQMLDIPANIGLCRPIKYAIDLINKYK